MRSIHSAAWLCVLCAFLVSPALADDNQEKEEPTKAVFGQIVLKGTYPETADAGGLLGEIEEHLAKIVGRLDKAAKDSKVQGIILRIENPSLGAGKRNELISAIERLRDADKTVVAVLEMGITGDYLIAAACDEIVMPPSGTLVLPGIHAEFSFMKGTLDKLGIQAEFIQMGKYKSAAEQLTRASMSEANREQWNALVDDSFDQVLTTIATSRGLKKGEVKKIIDEGLFSAQRAKELKLIDRVAYEDSLPDEFAKQLQVDEVSIKREYAKKQLDTDFSGLTGFIKLMELITGTEAAKSSSSKPKIAVVYAVGAIVSGKSEQGLMGGQTCGSATIIKALREAAEDDGVKAIVLRVDSPGGSAIASDLIWREVSLIDKPVIASMGDVAASGGYYISMGADTIYAEPGTLTGSIGVIGGKMAVQGLYEKIGVTTDVIQRGKNAGLFNGTNGFTDSEREVWTRMMKETYDQFLSKAAEGRGLDRKTIEEYAQGRVWSGRMAAERKLVDKLGTLHDAVTAAKQAGGLDADDEVELMTLPKPKTFIEQLFGGSEVSAQLKMAVPEVAQPLGQVETMRKLLNERVLLLMPYNVTIR